MAVPVVDLSPRSGLPGPGPGSSWTCTRAAIRASRPVPVAGSCPSTPSRRSMPAAACIPRCPPRPAGPSATSTSTSARGSLALLAGLDVHTGQVFASTPLTTGIKPFMDLAGQVMARPGYKNAPRVFVIVDNGPDHRGQAAVTRLAKAHPNAIMIHTPLHASWLNQIEIFFIWSLPGAVLNVREGHLSALAAASWTWLSAA